MIKRKQIEIYLKYQDIDNFARAGSMIEKNIVSEKDWYHIDNLIHDIHLIKNNLVSIKMKEEIECKISEYTAGDSGLIQKLFLLK